MLREFGREIESDAHYSPIKVVDAVHHRVRESTDAVLQIGSRVQGHKDKLKSHFDAFNNHSHAISALVNEIWEDSRDP